MITLRKNKAKNLLSRIKTDSGLNIAMLYDNIIETIGGNIYHRLYIPSERGKMDEAVCFDFNEFRKNIVTFPDEVIKIYQDGAYVVVTGETGSVKIPTIDTDEYVFPEIKEPGKKIPIGIEDIRKLALSIEPKDYLTAVDVISKDGKIYFFSTYNLYWLTLIIKDFSSDEQISCSFHPNHVFLLRDKSRVTVTGNFSIVEDDDLVSVSPLLAKVPQIPFQAATLPNVITCQPINNEKLKDVTKIIAGIGESNTAIIDFEPEQLIITSEDERARFTIPARTNSTGTFYVDAQRLNRFIQATNEPTIEVFQSPNGTRGLRIAETDEDNTATFFCIAERRSKNVR